MGSPLAVRARGRRFRRHARRPVSAPRSMSRPAGLRANDFVAVAERFVGTPYLWGGKSSLGIDCSGLVQVSLNAAGTGCPRDSDMQQDGLGRALDPTESKKLQRGDLIFWKGHVAIVRDADTHRSRQRASHGDGDREHPRRHRADQGRRQRGHGDQAAVSGVAAQSATAPPGAVSSRKAAANSARV